MPKIDPRIQWALDHPCTRWDMAEFVIKLEKLQAGEVTPDQELSLRRVGEWIATRASTQALLEQSADLNLPFRIVARVGDDEVPVVAIHVKRWSPAEVPS